MELAASISNKGHLVSNSPQSLSWPTQFVNDILLLITVLGTFKQCTYWVNFDECMYILQLKISVSQCVVAKMPS